MTNHQDTKTPRRKIPQELDDVATQVVDGAYCVHRALGAGLLESVYEQCLIHELKKRGLDVRGQVRVPIYYDGIRLATDLKLDLLVNNSLIVELKAVETLLPLYTAQVLTYLKLSTKRLALLINFNVPRIKDGIRRIVL